MGDARDVYAPTPGWTPPPRDDAPRWDIPAPADPCLNPYAHVDCAFVARVSMPTEPQPQVIPEPPGALLVAVALLVTFLRRR